MTGTPVRGWLGGTFDPIHMGHLDVARAARAALSLTRVTFAPARRPPHRAAPHASPADRLAMLRLATDEPWMDISTIELDHDAPSFTATTLDRLDAGGIDLRSLILIAGADAFAGISTWHRASSVLDRVSIAVVSRPGHPAGTLPGRLPDLAARMCDAQAWRTAQWPAIVLVDAPTSPVSSTGVRAAVAAGQSLTGLVPGPVASYIAAHDLYKVNPA